MGVPLHPDPAATAVVPVTPHTLTMLKPGLRGLKPYLRVWNLNFRFWEPYRRGLNPYLRVWNPYLLSVPRGLFRLTPEPTATVAAPVTPQGYERGTPMSEVVSEVPPNARGSQPSRDCWYSCHPPNVENLRVWQP